MNKEVSKIMGDLAKYLNSPFLLKENPTVVLKTITDSFAKFSSIMEKVYE